MDQKLDNSNEKPGFSGKPLPSENSFNVLMRNPATISASSRQAWPPIIGIFCRHYFYTSVDSKGPEFGISFIRQREISFEYELPGQLYVEAGTETLPLQCNLFQLKLPTLAEFKI
jgi:hypothetical protein